jgi:GR25 family glycosyltransferase involved in LPS biosynthesis
MLRRKKLPFEILEVERPVSRDGSRLRLGEVGVWRGHRKAWQAVVDHPAKHDFTLILEDDAVLPGMVSTKNGQRYRHGSARKLDYTQWPVAIPREAHVIFLYSTSGGREALHFMDAKPTVKNHEPLPNRTCHGVTTVETYVRGYLTLGYLVTRAGAELLLKITADNAGFKFNLPIDGYLCNRKLRSPELSVYVAMDILASTNSADHGKSSKAVVSGPEGKISDGN